MRVSSDAPITYNGVKYRGDIILTSSGGNSFSIINDINLEEYVKGVLRSEMPPTWHIEALKAQAILARTYAMSSSGKHNDCDVCATTHCQFYKGINAETPRVVEAVEATRGMYLAWGSGPASGLYHADSGGMPASSANVWGRNIDYLRSVPEPVSYKGTNTTWRTTLSMSYISSRLNGSGVAVGDISTITPLKRDESGRVLQIAVKGAASTKTVSGAKYRSALGADKIKSTLFEFRQPRISYADNTYAPPAARPQPASNGGAVKDINNLHGSDQDKLVLMTKNKIFTTAELMEMLSKPEKSNYYLKIGMERMKGKNLSLSQEQTGGSGAASSASLSNFQLNYSPAQLSNAPASGGSITIYGRGFGHGVGLSQWGCKALAESGWDYRQILLYYFPGTSILQ
ncbi:MAG: SpoIID/LytB domain-containing protein [Synergistaceae bacterium]|nr:SpoIID/LytB domain-containing protein [Synergistaceae bacterium]